MSTPTVEIKDPDIIEIPPDMQLGFDADGLPKTDPVEQAAEPEADKTKEELARLQRERDEMAEARQRAETEVVARSKDAQHAQEALEAERKVRVEREGQVLQSHLHRVASDYRTVETQIQTMENAAASIDAMASTLEQQIAAASEAGNHTQLGALNRKIAQLEAQKQTHESGIAAAKERLLDIKTDYDRAYAAAAAPRPDKEAKPEVKPEPKKDDPPAQVTPDQWIDSVKGVVGDAGTKWLKDNREFVTDGAKNAQLVAFSQYYGAKHGQSSLKSEAFVKALNAEFLPETEDETMSEEAPAKVEPKATTKAKATPAAPVSRGGSVFSSTNLDAKQVRLPPKLAAFVKASGLDPTQYALGAVEDIKAGRLPKNFLDPDYDHNF